jgi:cephalosporin hydroxylase
VNAPARPGYRLWPAVRGRLQRWGVIGWVDRRVVRLVGLSALLRHTGNFGTTTWLGRPVWQNLADLWTVQEIIVDRNVDFVVESGTNRGGSAYFMATVFDLLGRGRIITIDVEDLVDFEHPRIEFVQGSSTDDSVVRLVRERVAAAGAKEVLVLLDSDHSAPHVLRELHFYAPLVSVGGYVVVQDGVLDELPGYTAHRPGPLAAIRQFLQEDDRFSVDEGRSAKYLFHSSPEGCLRRTR